MTYTRRTADRDEHYCFESEMLPQWKASAAASRISLDKGHGRSRSRAAGELMSSHCPLRLQGDEREAGWVMKAAQGASRTPSPALPSFPACGSSWDENKFDTGRDYFNTKLWVNLFMCVRRPCTPAHEGCVGCNGLSGPIALRPFKVWLLHLKMCHQFAHMAEHLSLTLSIWIV